jgi:hypothetical protein
VIKLGGVSPGDDAGAEAVRQVQRVYEQKAGLPLMIPHTRVKPFDHADDALEVIEIIIRRESSGVFGWRQRAEGVRLTEMNQCSGLPDGGGVDVATNQGVNQRGFADAGYSFDEQRIEWRY